VKIGPSPRWMQERLLACGMRPIVNVVDITNYVMLEYGQPLHSFDARLIRRDKISVRPARESEEMTTLDGEERKLTPDMLVIADTERPVAIAGVMGGFNSEVTEFTPDILLESANFNAASIHYTARTLGLPSEASMRFERNIQPGLTVPALKRATQLMVELAGGTAASGIIDEYPGKKEAAPIKLSVPQMNKILGTTFTAEQSEAALAVLGFTPELSADKQDIIAITPYWRGDASLPVDLMEEVARIIGYDQIPSTLLSAEIPRQNQSPIVGLETKIKACLTGYGFYEAITYSLLSLEALGKIHPAGTVPEPLPLQLLNPMTAEQEYLRPTLRSNMISTLAANRRHEDGEVLIFELGNTFHRRDCDLPEEQVTLSAIMSQGSDKTWLGEARQLDFYDAKGIVEGLFAHLELVSVFEPSADAGLHPTRQAAITVGGDTVGILGELHPKVASTFEVNRPVFIIEVNASALVTHTGKDRMFQPIPRFPAMIRDMALIVEQNISHQQITDIISGYSLVASVDIFDIYSGEQVPAGKKSLAYRVVYQSATETLKEDEINRMQAQILAKLGKQLGATLRT
ncbi:phenylalanine--tRNA ligase subunit beta, partial [Chloroflexota bacterium]